MFTNYRLVTLNK